MKAILFSILFFACASINFSFSQNKDVVCVIDYKTNATYGGAACSGVSSSTTWTLIVKQDSVQITGLLKNTDLNYKNLMLNKGDTLVFSSSDYHPYNNIYLNYKSESTQDVNYNFSFSGNKKSINATYSNNITTIQKPKLNEPIAFIYKGKTELVSFPMPVSKIVCYP